MYFHLRAEHVKILKCHSHTLCAGLVDFYINLTYNLTIRKSDKKNQPDHYYEFDIAKD